uniref:Calcyon neuron specific vesicular protein n=1 Tax=Macaca fascicularis TaxID=9541 RepID=A0A2K5WDP1_MACFA
MVKLGCSFSGKPGKDPGDQDGAAMDSVPLISPLDVSQLQPPLPDQVVIKTQTEYQLSSLDQQKKFPDLEGQRLNCSHPEEGRRLPTARMIAFAMALLGCVLIMYKAIWYDQFTCPDGFLLRHKICTPLTLEMYYTEMDPERHRSILAAIGAYPLSRKHGTETPAAWGTATAPPRRSARGPPRLGRRRPPNPGKPSAKAEKEAARKAAGSAAPRPCSDGLRPRSPVRASPASSCDQRVARCSPPCSCLAPRRPRCSPAPVGL